MQTWGKLLDIIYPPKCSLCNRIGNLPICKECKSSFKRFGKTHSASGEIINEVHCIYQYEGRVAQAIKRLKYDRVTSLARPMSQILYDFAQEKNLLEDTLVIPIPISKQRLWHRGFNQSILLAEYLCDNPHSHSELKRTKHTKPQVGLQREDRLKNLMGAFEASQNVAGKHVLLLDDVITTGGTGIAATKELKDKGALSVNMLTFAGE